MKYTKVMQEIEQKFLKKDLPEFRVGDTLSIHTRIIEGDKERIQVFTGTLIARKGQGLSETMTLYRISYGSKMERVFLIHSPLIATIEVLKRGKVRKSKLYYLKGTSGKASKVKERIGKKVSDGKQETTATPTA